MLLENVIPAHPDPDKKFLLECDASNVGLGYILAQKFGNLTKVVAFGSRALIATKQSYSATERDALWSS